MGYLSGQRSRTGAASRMWRRTPMGIGVSIFLLALGAILTFAVEAAVAGIDLDVVGVILMAVGALGLVMTLLVWVRAAGSPGWSVRSPRGGRSWKSAASTTIPRCSRSRRPHGAREMERSHPASIRDLPGTDKPRPSAAAFRCHRGTASAVDTLGHDHFRSASRPPLPHPCGRGSLHGRFRGAPWARVSAPRVGVTGRE